MAKNTLRPDLIEKSFAFKEFGKRRCDFDKQELREYNRLKQQQSRQRRRLGGE